MQNRTFLFTLVGAALVTLGIIATIPLIPEMSTAPDAVWANGLYSQKIAALNRLRNGRIYVVSGSSSLFSLDTQVLSRAVGRRVVNLGTHAGLGVNYILDRAERQMQPGDIIIFTPEYPIFLQPPATQTTLAFVPFFDRPYIATRPINERIQFYLGYGVLDSIWQTLKLLRPGAKPGLIEGDMSLDDLGNARGNSVTKSVHDWRRFGPEGAPLPITATAIDALRTFKKRAQERNVQIITFPAPLIHLPAWDTSEQHEMRNHIRSVLQAEGLNPRGEDQTGWIEPTGIYDAAFHANDAGRAAYTHRIAVLLCAQIRCANPPH